ncbi:chemotaxis protein CheC [Oxalobacteraceae bacterium A2-2]
MIALSELESDALVQIFNIGATQAAAAMSTIVREPVRLSVPSINFVERGEVARQLGRSEPGPERICGVSQQYAGEFQTEALVMFPEDKSLEIVRLMIGEAIPLQELTEMEQEALCEIGNIILNSCVGAMATIFQRELSGSLPRYHIGTSGQILNAGGGSEVVLMLHIDFVLEKHQIHGYVAFVLDVVAQADLQDHIKLYIARAMGQG